MMEATPAPPTLFVGVGCPLGVAAATAAVATMTVGSRPTRAFTIAQTPQGFAALRERLDAIGYAPHEMLIVMEATGTYWMRLATTLADSGYGVSVINPRQAHNFAKTLLKRAKTDAIDAQLLARLGALLQPAPHPEGTRPPPAIYTELQQRLAHRDALVAMRQQTCQQLHALVQQPVVVAAVRERLDGVIAFLTAQLADLDAEIAATIQQDAVWAEAAARLQTIVGIGVLTSAWLLVATLNLLHLSQARSLGGLRRPRTASAPIGHQRRGAYGCRSVWACPVADGALPSNPKCRALQSRHQTVLRPLTCPWESAQGRALCGSAEAVTYRVGRGDQEAAVRPTHP